MLEKNPESPLDSKEIKPLNLKGNQLNTKKKNKIKAPGPINSWHIEGENVEAVTIFLF